ncbi:hypothetical protein ACFWFQ_10685 [Nocardia salmonicida]|uniref:hypothetical protein n=1 Tax=Nocardia salmonicida TaxID=53431 RepID=UPI00366301BF
MRVLSAHQSAAGTPRQTRWPHRWSLRPAPESRTAPTALVILRSDPITKRPQPEASSSRFSLYLSGHPLPGPICAQFRLRSTLADAKVPNRPGQSVPTNLAGVAFNADGSEIAVGAHDGKVRIWDVARLIRNRRRSMRIETRYSRTDSFPTAVWCPVAKRESSGSWVLTAARSRSCRRAKEVRSLDVSQKGLIVTGRNDGFLTLSDSTGRGSSP